MSNDEEMNGKDLLPEDEALETLSAGSDVAMDSEDDENIEVDLQNDSIAHFDKHRDSVFSIAQHPLYPALVATGGSEGDGDDAPGKGYIIDTSAARSRPVLPASFSSDPSNVDSIPQSIELASSFDLDGHKDSITALAFTLPKGEFLVSGSMDGRLRVYAVGIRHGKEPRFKFLSETAEEPEINWIAACPNPEYTNTIALGASDGSVWVYSVDLSDLSSPLRTVQSYFLHTGACTAGSWTPDGNLLATVAEDSSFYVWDVWGLGAAQNMTSSNGMTVMSLTGDDQRFEVEGGLYSVAIESRGAYAAVGGVGGAVKVVTLPRLSPAQQGGKGKTAGPSPGGQIMATIDSQSDTIETLAFSTPTPNPQQPILLAAGSVDGSIAVFDTSKNFATRRHILGAHDDHAVVKVEFVKSSWMLTSAGMDGVLKRWDLRLGGQSTGASNAAQGQAGQTTAGLVKEWKGHRGDGAGGGVLGFVQGETGERIITAGDDGVVLVFEA